MNKPTNIKEFKALVLRYQTITLEEIKAIYDALTDPMPPNSCLAEYVTGFGDVGKCTLCVAVEFKRLRLLNHENTAGCRLCVYWTEHGGPLPCCDHSSYHAIDQAKTPEELLKAYQERAKYLVETYAQYLID